MIDPKAAIAAVALVSAAALVVDANTGNCIESTGVVDATQEYVLVRSCDGDVPSGVTLIGAPRPLEPSLNDKTSMQRGKEIQWPCACSTGSKCERLVRGKWAQADTYNNVIPSDEWRGDGCLRTQCAVVAGASSYPDRCVR